MEKKLFAIVSEGTGETLGLVDESLKVVLEHVMRHFITIVEITSTVSTGTRYDSKTDESITYLGLQPVGTHAIKDQLEFITKQW